MRRGFLCSVAALLASTGLALAQVPAPTEAPSPPAEPWTQTNPPVVGGGATPYSPLAPNGVTPAPFGLSAGGPGELMTCPGGACGGDCGNVFNQPAYRGTQAFWINSEYLLWRTKTANIPSLSFLQPLGTVTFTQVNNANGVSQNFVQQLPVLALANSNSPGLSWKDQPGMRFSAGFWFDKDQTLGFDAGFFMLWRRSEQFANVPNQSPTGTPFQLLIPTGIADQIAVSSGTINAATINVPINVLIPLNSQSIGHFSSAFWGSDFNFRSRKCYFGCTTIDCLVGARYLNLAESINTTENLAIGPGTITPNPVGSTPATATIGFNGSINDGISVQNNFYGAQVGFAYDWKMGGGLFLSGWTKLAVGDMHEDIALHGFTTGANGQGGSTTLAGGNLVGPADNNTFRVFDRIAAVPEFAMNLGYQPCSWCRFYGGYTFLYVSSLARPGDQTTFVTSNSSVTINGASQSASIVAPTFKVQDTNFWAQGINFGVEFRY